MKNNHSGLRKISGNKEERTRGGKSAPAATAKLEVQRLKWEEPEQIAHVHEINEELLLTP
jgi:hypothetical protein